MAGGGTSCRASDSGFDRSRLRRVSGRGDGGFVELFGLAALDPNCAARAMTEAGAHAVAEAISDQASLSVDDPQRALGTSWNAKAAAVAQFLINGDHFSLHGWSSYWLTGEKRSRSHTLTG